MGTPLRLLMLEDRETDAHSVVDELRQAGYDPDWRRVDTETGFVAELARAPDLILSDFSMRQFDALRALELVRKFGLEIPFIVVSGSIGEDMAVTAMQRGAADYLLKDRLGRLGQAVGQALEQRRLRDEKRRAEEALRDSEGLFRHAFEDTNVAMVLTDLNHRFVRANDAFARLFGYSKREVLELSMADITHPDDVAESYARRQELLAGKATFFQMEKRYLHKDGHVLWGVTNVALVRDAGGAPRLYVGQVQDITERRRHEEALRANEERTRLILDTAYDPFIAMDEEGRITEWNAQAEKVFGWSRAEALGRMLSETIIPSQYRTAHEHGLIRFLATGDGPILNKTIELTALKKNGAEFPVEVIIWPIRVNGKFTFSSFVRDITARKKAEEALRRAEAKYRNIFENAVEGIFQTSPEGRHLIVNPALARMYGYDSPEDLMGSVMDIERQLYVDPPRRREFVRQVQERGEVTGFESKVYRKDGTIMWISEHARAVRGPGGKVAYYEGTVEDITERKWAEESLHEITAKFQSLVQASPLAIIALDRHGRVMSWNPAAASIFGWSEREVLGQPLPIVPADQKKEFQTMIAEEWQGATRTNMELSRLRKDGALVDVSLWTAPLRDARGQIVATLFLMADITEQKRLGEQFRQAQKMEAIGRLAGGVAHDFNNLLTVILGCSEIVLGKLRAGDPLYELVEQVHKAGERAALLTRQLLAFSRKQVLMPVVLDLSAHLLDMEKLLRRLIGEDIELHIVADPHVWPVKADAGQLEQVIMNLAVNSRDAMPQGGKLTIETTNVRLDANYVARHPTVQPGPYVRLAITDTGSGMDPATMARIFEPFFSTKGAKGTGLGLATVFGIVKQSGGFIEVYSEVGLGTTFKIYLPRDASAMPNGKSHAGLGVARHGTETILLVEDEDGVRSLASSVLRNHGYKVLEASNGGEAFLLCERCNEPIDLLVTDVVMPNLSGRQLAERLATLRPFMKVLYLSGYTDDAIVQHGVLDAGTPFLNKPFSPDALARKVRDLLDAKTEKVSDDFIPQI